MRVLIFVSLITSLIQTVQAQKYWDGGGMTDKWADSANWYPDGIPISTDNVILDNQFVQNNYNVELPTGNNGIQINSIIIHPASNVINLILPAGNTAVPGLQMNSIDSGLVIYKGGFFKNSSGASSGNTLLLNGKVIIYNGGTYIHNTARSNASISDKLIFPIGTDQGTFEFDVPGTAGYTISITGKTFGNLHFKSTTAGGNKSYSGSGSSNLNIKGNLFVDVGANLTSTMTADMIVSGNFIIDGKINFNTSTAGSSSRRMILDGIDSKIVGSGIISGNSNFRGFEIAKSGSVHLMRNIVLNNVNHLFKNFGRLYTDSFYIGGTGTFMQMDSSFLHIGDSEGINSSNISGNIRTDSKNFSKNSCFIFDGHYPQITGDAIPDSILQLTIYNPQSVTLSKKVFVKNSLYLFDGILNTKTGHEIIFNASLLQSPKNAWNLFNAGWESSYINGPFITDLSGNVTKMLPAGSVSQFAPIHITNLLDSVVQYNITYTDDIDYSSQLSTELISLHQKGIWKVQTASSAYQLKIPISTNEISSMPIGIQLTGTLLNDQSNIWTKCNSVFSTDSISLHLDSTFKGNQQISIGYFSPEYLLPVSIYNLHGRKIGQQIHLIWNANSNVTDGYFVIQESSDGITFQEIDRINLANISLINNEYSWTGRFNPKMEYGFYRIQFLNGLKVESSEIIKLNLLELVELLYPNPAGEIFFIKFQNPCNEYLLEIVNIYGIVVQREKIRGNRNEIKVSNLKSGNYWVRLSSGNRQQILHLTKY